VVVAVLEDEGENGVFQILMSFGHGSVDGQLTASIVAIGYRIVNGYGTPPLH
jgi:hypothetical protein